MQRAVVLMTIHLLYLIVSSLEGRLLFDFLPSPTPPHHNRVLSYNPLCRYVWIFHLFQWAILCVYNRVDGARSTLFLLLPGQIFDIFVSILT